VQHGRPSRARHGSLLLARLRLVLGERRQRAVLGQARSPVQQGTGVATLRRSASSRASGAVEANPAVVVLVAPTILWTSPSRPASLPATRFGPSACAPTTCTSCHSPPSSTRHPLPSSASPRPSRRRPALPPRPIAQPGPPSSRACTIQHAAQPSEPVQWARLARDRTSRPTRSQGDELLPDSASLAASRPAPRALRRLCTVGRRGAGSLSQSRPSRVRASLARSPLCPRSAQLSRLSPSAPQRLSRLRPSSHPSTNDDDELAQVHDAARVGGPPRAIDGCAGQRRAMEQRRHGPGPRGQAGVEVVLVREHVGVGRVLVRRVSLAVVVVVARRSRTDPLSRAGPRRCSSPAR